MKTTHFFKQLMLLAVLLPFGCRAAMQNTLDGPQKYYFAVEINGVLCGYSESQKHTVTEDGRTLWTLRDDIQVKLTLLGQDVDISIKNDYKIDTVSGLFTYCKHVVSTGVTDQVAISRVEGRKVFFSTAEDQDAREIILEPDVILDSPLTSPHLVEDFIHGGKEEMEYRVYDDMAGEVITKAYTLVGEEQLELAGIKYAVTVLDEMNMKAGYISRIWIDKESGYHVKIEVAGRTIYLADESVKKKIRLADMDNLLFARVNTVIPDIQNITRMKVNAIIQSAGEWITPENLNFPGQKFTGTVTNNLIEGLFEIESIRYDGIGAPGFPYEYALPDSLEEYVKPGKLIESDHPDLVREAADITEGSTNAWEAAVRLSRWVSDNVSGAIPGGTSAINTYRTREGECGSHSRLLAAFCRASGIPARLSIGCMYSTYLGGSFGQHAWTEVFMGDAGWIAVDATAEEYDYVDAGHIRLGEAASFNPKAMEILEYQVGEGESDGIGTQVPEKYSPYPGKYTILEKGKVFTVLFQDGSLVVDIPNQVMLALNDPDEEGLWYPKLTRQINFKFLEEENGQIRAMRLQQIIPVPKKSDSSEKEADSPSELQKYRGNYELRQANATFRVTCEGDSLILEDPVTRQTVMLIHDKEGSWKLMNSENKIRFEMDGDGTVKSMTYYEHILLQRGEPVSVIMRQWIDQYGIEEGINRYKELKASGSHEYIITEKDINTLGYAYLADGKINEAIAIFVTNAEAFPDSWNVYDSLGEAYRKKGNIDQAIENYARSVELNPGNENGIKAMDEMKETSF